MSRIRKSVVGLIVVPLLLAYGMGATALEKRRMAASATLPDPQRTSATYVNGDRLMADTQTLSSPEFAGRLTGSTGSHKAQALILARFRELGVKPIVGGTQSPQFEQRFGFTHRSLKGLFTPGRPFRREFPDATNLVGVIEGDVDVDRYTAVTAHYDHLGVRDGQVYPGADDNASGVAVMLAAAEYFTAHRTRRSLLLVAFDGEEEGLRGSAFFVANPPLPLDRIAFDVNLDMVARGDANELVAAGTYFSPDLRDPLVEIARGHRLRLLFGHDRPIYRAGAVEDWTHASDHGPFHDAGIPFIYLGVEDHPDYHRPTDTADRIPRAFYVDAANLIVDVVRAVDGRRRR